MRLTKDQSLQVKGMAILLLMFHHLFYQSSRYAPYQISPRFLSAEQFTYVAYTCRTCVWVFAFISAYGIATLYETKKVDRTNICPFIYQRYISLMSGFWFIYPLIFLFAWVAQKHPFQTYQSSILVMLPDVLGLSDFFQTPTLGGVWWYMTFAQVLILSVPVLIYMGRRLSYLLIPILFLVMQLLPSDAGITSKFGGIYLSYIPAVAMGVVLAQQGLAREETNADRKRELLLAFGSLAACVVTLWVRTIITQEGFPYNVSRIPWFLSSFAAVCFVFFAKQIAGNGRLARALRFLGKHSGNMFLIHAFFYYYIPDCVYFSGSIPISFLTLFAESLAASLLIERIKIWVRYPQFVGWLKRRMT